MEMSAVTGKSSVVAYLVNELNMLPDIAEDLCTTHSSIIDQGVAYRSFDYYVAHKVMQEECARRGVQILPDDCFTEQEDADEYEDDWDEDDEDEDEDDWDDDEDEEEDRS
jgi:hypothetical protein